MVNQETLRVERKKHAPKIALTKSDISSDSYLYTYYHLVQMALNARYHNSSAQKRAKTQPPNVIIKDGNHNKRPKMIFFSCLSVRCHVDEGNAVSITRNYKLNCNRAGPCNLFPLHSNILWVLVLNVKIQTINSATLNTTENTREKCKLPI